MKKKIIAAALVLCMLLTCFGVVGFTANAVTTDKAETAVPAEYSAVSANPYGITSSNDDATILQAWNWSYANITKEIDKIAEQGFSVIQISPPNEIKQGTTGHKVDGESSNGWWMFYQPAGFQINQSTDNALGTKSQLVTMVKAAHAKGIRVIADSVINHMGTCDGEDNISSSDPMQHVTPKAKTFEPEIYNNKLFHSPWFNMTYSYEWTGPESTCTNDLTRGCTSRLPDLKTEDSRVQTAIYEYLQELVDCGVDGFRFDAAKHIETPSDSANYRSNFWTNTVTKVRTYAKNTYGKDVLSYGEILNTCGYGRSYNFYFPFMKVTDSTIYRQVQNAVNGGSASQAIPQNMANGTKAQTVLWDESHDTYMDGSSKNFSKAQRNKTWAAIAARDGITSMYLARPASLSQQLGVASETDWTSKEVAEVNKFNNNFSGQGEYLATSGTVAIIGRGSKTQDGGAVLVNCSGTTKAVSGATVATMADGTYTDRVGGGTFTVSGGKISGSIGSTGIAVLYNEPGPTVAASQSGTYNTATKTITLTSKNVDNATYSINGGAATAFSNGHTVTLGTSADTAGATYVVRLKGYVSGAEKASAEFTYTKVEQESEYKVTVNTNGVFSGAPNIYMWNSANDSQNNSWPGEAMSGSGTTYTFTVPASYDRIIFNKGTKQTVDITITESTNYTILSSTTTNAGGTACNNVSSEKAGATVPTYYPGVNEPTQAPTTAPVTAPVTTVPIITDPPTVAPTTAPIVTQPVVTTAPQPTTAPATISGKYAYGDVNRDFVVDVRDVTMIQKYLVKLIQFDGEQKILADFNKDGRPSIQDATAIQYSIVSK